MDSLKLGDLVEAFWVNDGKKQSITGIITKIKKDLVKLDSSDDLYVIHQCRRIIYQNEIEIKKELNNIISRAEDILEQCKDVIGIDKKICDEISELNDLRVKIDDINCNAQKIHNEYCKKIKKIGDDELDRVRSMKPQQEINTIKNCISGIASDIKLLKDEVNLIKRTMNLHSLAV